MFSYLTRKGSGVAVLLVLCFCAFSQEYNFRHLGETDGLAQSYVYSIAQDQQGCLWIGTGNGLSKYNGLYFENYTTADSLADNFIASSIADGQEIWLGHMNGAITLFNGRNFRAIQIPVAEPGPLIHFAENADGQIWGISASGLLYQLSKHEGIVQKFSFSDLEESVITFEFTGSRELLIGTSNGLMHCRLKDPGTIEVVRTVQEIPESKVVGIVKERNGSGFYIATENEGIYKLQLTEHTFVVSLMVFDSEFDFSGIQCIYEDTRSAIWLGTFGNGLVRVNNPALEGSAKISVYNKANGFVSDNVKVIFEDISGNIWSGNYGEGLSLITDRVYSFVTFDREKYGSAVYSIYANGHHRWIGTEKGLLKFSQGTGEMTGFYGKGLPEDIITAIYTADGRDIWIGTDKNGVYRMNAERGIVKPYPISPGVLENSITSITGQPDQVWIGTKKGLCNINLKTGSHKWYTISQGGLPHNYIHALFADHSGRLWVSSQCNILAYIQNEKIYTLPVSSLSILTFGPITQAIDSAIWVGSNGNGIYRIENDSVLNLTTKEGLLSDYCYSIVSDDRGYIWVSHKNGLSKIRIADFFVKSIQQFEDANRECQFHSNAAFRDNSGKIWFGAENGLIVYDPERDHAIMHPPVPGITAITINNEIREYSSKVVLNPGKYKVRFDFIAINLKDPSVITYRYKLEGFDQEYEYTKGTSVTYNNLTEGNYVFILDALSGDGVASDLPINIEVVIKKPIWKRLWFLPTQVLVLIGLLFFYLKRREYRFKEEKRILEEKVRERTFEIQSQKDEIERNNKVIQNKNNEITSSIKYASHIQQAVLPSMDLLEEIFPDNFILMIPRDIVSGDFYWFTERDGKIIFTVADCTGHGIPGAFMSIMSITLLNEIVNIKGITDSAEIVNQLHSMINQSLRKSKMDGLDLALCVLDQQKGEIQFTGAMNHLVHIHQGKLNLIKADHFSVNSLRDDFSPFSQKVVNLKKGDVIYLFSDGYVDQFGGEKDKKYSGRRFHSTLLEIHQLPMGKQLKLLKKKHLEWKGNGDQTDDIMVMGIRY